MKELPERTLGNYELQEFFRVIDSGWNWLSWWAEGAWFTYDKSDHVIMVSPGNPKPSENQNYVIVCHATPYKAIITWICHHFHMSEYQVFERNPVSVYGDYGMAFTFLPQIEEMILKELST